MARLADPLLALRRRRQILDAALVCFRRRGFHQATVQEICAEAQISAGALYRYFPSKADIIAAIAEDHRREIDGALLAVRGGGSLMDALSIVSQSFFKVMAEEGDGPLFCDVVGEAARDPILAARLIAIDAASRARLATAIEAAQARGEVDPKLDSAHAADAIFAIIEGIGIRNGVMQRLPSRELAARFRSLAARYLGCAA